MSTIVNTYSLWSTEENHLCSLFAASVAGIIVDTDSAQAQRSGNPSEQEKSSPHPRRPLEECTRPLLWPPSPVLRKILQVIATFPGGVTRKCYNFADLHPGLDGRSSHLFAFKESQTRGDELLQSARNQALGFEVGS